MKEAQEAVHIRFKPNATDAEKIREIMNYRGHETYTEMMRSLINEGIRTVTEEKKQRLSVLSLEQESLVA